MSNGNILTKDSIPDPSKNVIQGVARAAGNFLRVNNCNAPLCATFKWRKARRI